MIGSTFHLSSNSHRSGDCPCKLVTSSSSIWTAAETNDFDTITSRISQNSSLVSKFDAYGYTALHYAAQQNHVRIVEYLLVKGCPPDANNCGATPLHRAAYSGSFVSCQLLLKAGADVNAVDSSYRDLGSPLHKAYSVANVEIVNLLLESGANPLLLDAACKIPRQLLKKKYEKNFPKLEEDIMSAEKADAEANVDDQWVRNKEEKNDFKITATSEFVQGSDLSISNTVVIPNIDSDSREKETKVLKPGSIGLVCCQCNLTCISFTRLTDGTLLCTDCKYKAY
jgi:ankyrin repeat protein